MVGQCTVRYGGVLCGRAGYCAVGWCTECVVGRCTVCYGSVLYGRAVYCVVARCTVW